MINLDELKPILEGLIDGREDSAEIIEQVTALDKPVEVDRSEIDAINESWNERFKKAFFGDKSEFIDETIPKEDTVEDENYDGEDLKYEGLFEEVKEEKED